ncbi:acyltransferase [Paraclostridium sordellii]|uniref:Acyltransferase 3 n=1 Tax=Paraclostridium sordellii TaxID=1505 RepID=A0A9P1L1V3_PARSO|nr:acyltransferase family protein [Paeniclostridium sordellii]CEO32986.1 acyltransferase 3 [[Clostridium] sordellii] [Paeniclostridium sordellii]
MNKERILYYDLIRTIACFLVIVNHTIWMFGAYNKLPMFTWIVSDALFFIAKMAVPLFIMLSGALLLDKEESYKHLAIHKVFKMTFILLVWSLIYATYAKHSILTFGDIFREIKAIIKQPISIHLWYLYMLIGLYIITPFLRKMIKNFTDKDFIIFIIIWILYSTLLPFIGLFKSFEFSKYLAIPFFSGYIGYYIAGFYLDNIEINKNKIILSVIIFFTGLIISTYITFIMSKVKGTTYMGLDNVRMFPIMLMSLSFFLIVKNLGEKIHERLNKEKTKRIIVNISSATFGIYLIHTLLNRMLGNSPLYNIIFSDNINPILGLVIYDILIFLLSYIIISIIRKIPIIKNIA